MDGVFDQAIADYYQNKFHGSLMINNHYGQADEMNLDIYFRDEDNLNGFEAYALSMCRGIVLDIGAGVGSLSLILQNRALVTQALEISSTCCNIMKERGVLQVTNQNLFEWESEPKFDTLLMMMNGFGICGELSQLPLLFDKLSQLLNSGGQVLFDSSDVKYLYDGDLPKNNYYGEIDYQYEYNGKRGPWFKWLYIDIDTLAGEAKKNGFHLQVLSEDADGQYFGRLIKS